jgi:hypothetical protein
VRFLHRSDIKCDMCRCFCEDLIVRTQRHITPYMHTSAGGTRGRDHSSCICSTLTRGIVHNRLASSTTPSSITLGLSTKQNATSNLRCITTRPHVCTVSRTKRGLSQAVALCVTRPHNAAPCCFSLYEHWARYTLEASRAINRATARKSAAVQQNVDMALLDTSHHLCTHQQNETCGNIALRVRLASRIIG